MKRVVDRRTGDCDRKAIYLVVLAYAHDLAAMLPPRTRVITSDTSHLGLWTWSNTVHAMLPWHLPLLAMLLQTAVAVLMFRSAKWPAMHEETIAEQTAKRKPKTSRPPRAAHRRQPLRDGQSGRPQAAWLRFAPAGLLLLAAAAVGIRPSNRTSPDGE